MNRVYVFPGQGSQAVGMGKALADAFPAARRVFAEVDDALGENLTRLMFEGPEHDLMLTVNAQPALMAVSVATYRAVEDEGGFDVANDCRWVAGHSLGEYSALTAVGSLSIGDAARLLRVRGRAMQAAVPVGLGGMAALPLTLAEARAVAAEAAEGEVCVAANDNGPNQVVLSGALQAIKRALGIAARRGAKRSVLLPVSAPFHCELMAPAARAVEEALNRIRIDDPRVPLISNVTASAVERADDVRRLLVQQITSMVRWRETMLHLLEQGIHSVVEVGAGRVLSGLARRFDRNLHTHALATPDDIRAFIGSARTPT